ncbi:MAG TPA: Asd/ArgC dimerization domain-containing protein [Thermoanaerobaculia bacterium]
MSAIAILHTGDLLGKELRETIDRGEGGTDGRYDEIRLLSTREAEIGTLTEVMGAAALVQPYTPESLLGVEAAFFCGPIAANRPLLAELPKGVRAVVLSTDATPEDGTPVVAGINDAAAHGGRPLLSPHPAVVLLAHLLHPLAGLGLEQVVGTLVQPASMHGDAGLEELFEQTRQIVAMTQRRRSQVFGAQLAFNLLPAAVAIEPLVAMLAAVLGAAGDGPAVSLQVVQGGVFHCFSASLNVHLKSDPGLPALRRALSSNAHLQPADDPRHLGPIDAAASEKVLYGTPRKEGAGFFWLWAVMDNLTRGGALNALEIATLAR